MSEKESLRPKQQIFISYSHRDADTAESFARLCQETGANTWIDRTNIEAGENWKEKVLEAIQTCNVIVVLISQSSLSNDSWQKREWSAICERHWTQPEVQVVPIRLDESKLPAFLRQMQVLEGRDSNQLKRCASLISKHRGMEGTQKRLVITGEELEELKERFKQVFAALSEGPNKETSLDDCPEENGS